MHGLEREGGAPVQKINHINAVCFPVLLSSALFWELETRGFAPELLCMASGKGRLSFCGEKEPGMGKWGKRSKKWSKSYLLISD